MLTAQFLGNEVELISDVGVAGIHRLFHRLDTIQRANVLVVCGRRTRFRCWRTC